MKFEERQVLYKKYKKNGFCHEEIIERLRAIDEKLKRMKKKMQDQNKSIEDINKRFKEEFEKLCQEAEAEKTRKQNS